MKGGGRVEAVFVLLLMQGTSWLLAGLAAVVFGIAGERVMLLLGLLTGLLGWATFLLATTLLLRVRGARGTVLALEWMCLLWALVQALLPLGNRITPLVFLMGVLVPLTVLALLHGRRARQELAASH